MSGVPSGSGGYIGGMERCMDDDDNANDDDFEVRNLLQRLWRIGILRGWLILDRSGFPHSKPDSAASIKPRSKHEEFFSVSDPPEPVRNFMTLCRRISEIQPTSSERAARLLRDCRPLFISCLSGAGRYRSIIILTFVPNAFSIQTIRASVVRSPYRNPVPLPFFFFFNLVQLERTARVILAEIHNASGSFPRFWLSYKMMVSIHLSRLFLTGVSVTLRSSGCSDFGHGFYV